MPDSSTRYQGTACSKCGATERYKKNGGCVGCMKRRASEFYVKKYKGQPGTFQGNPCRTCSNTERYRHNGACVSCCRTRQMKRYYANKPQYKKRQLRDHLKRTYGLTLEAYDALLKKQNGVCAICQKPCVIHGRLSVDHRHTTGQTRGLLCGGCNAGLGRLGDDIALLKRAVAYLESYQS